MEAESGLTWELMEPSQDDLEFISSQIDCREIARIFGVPPELLGETHVRTNLLRGDRISIESTGAKIYARD